MKKTFFLIFSAAALSIMPAAASAAVVYSRTPSGSSVLSPVKFTASIDSFADTGCDGFDYWGFDVYQTTGDNSYGSASAASTSLSLTATMILPAYPGLYSVDFSCYSKPKLTQPLANDLDSNGNYIEDPATFAVSGNSSIIAIPNNAANGTAAVMSGQFTDSGTYKIVLIAVGIPLFFYVVHKLMGLFPGRKRKK
jgi:hypothetical protein